MHSSQGGPQPQLPRWAWDCLRCSPSFRVTPYLRDQPLHLPVSTASSVQMYLVVWYHRVERVVCVNPRRRRWCRDGIPDSGNAVQIPSLLPPDCHQLLSLPSHYCHTVNTAGGDGCTGCRSQVRCKARRCRCTRQQQHSICPSQSLPLPQNKFLSKAPLSIYFHHCFHLGT